MKPKKLIQCLIIDDEISSQRVLQHFVSETEILDLKATCNTTAEAFKYLQLHKSIDVLFLDINMPQQSGLDFYKSLKNPPQVIFTTAYSQYAVDGFNVNAADYLLKPIAYNRFLTAIHKIRDRLNNPENLDDFMVLKENKTLHKVFYKDMQYIEAFGDYVKVHTKEKTVTTHSTFTNFLENLPRYFLRTHKSYSVNSKRINQLLGNQITIDTYTVPIGKTYKQTVLKALNL
ncbi:MAG: LytR/AlgR family response regulator transcription factor [Winogradskyella sp.]